MISMIRHNLIKIHINKSIDCIHTWLSNFSLIDETSIITAPAQQSQTNSTYRTVLKAVVDRVWNMMITLAFLRSYNL